MQLFGLILQKVNQKSCAHEYNFVVRLPVQPVKMFILMHSFLVHIQHGQQYSHAQTPPLQRGKGVWLQYGIAPDSRRV